MKTQNTNLGCLLKETLSLIIAFFLLTQFTFSQSEVQKKTLKDFAERKSLEYHQLKHEADSLAKVYGMSIRGETGQGAVYELQYFDNGYPVYYITNNLNAAKTVSTDKVWPGGGAGLNLTGFSETLGIWDEAGVRTSHQELTGRVTQVDVPGAMSNHATHVAGTMIAEGVVDSAKGMAYEASLRAFDWNNDVSEMANEAANGLLVSNHSYGSISGWALGDWATPGTDNWHWWGDITISPTEDFKFGFYNSEAASFDSIAYNAPNYLIVKAAGNDRNDFHNGGHYVWSGVKWIWSTVARDWDGGLDEYDCIPTYGNAKNILTIGAVNDIPAGYSNSNDVVMTTFSGWGPTDDGRIKPDLVANGFNLYSSIASNNTSYDTYPGTSMATPNVSGSIGLLNQHYKNTHTNAILRSATMKALLIHSADEAGNVGPDYQFGWGLLNTREAAEIISDDISDGEGIHIRELTLNDGQDMQLRVWPKGTEPIKVTLAWTDPAGTPPPDTLNPTTRMLVNDLDLQVIDNASGMVYYPYSLDPAHPNNPATKAQNFRDNVEQVEFTPTGLCSRYTIKISHLGFLANGAQDFSVIITGNQSNIIYVKWDAFGNNDGTSWDDAYIDLHTAKTAAVSGNDIWIARGIYYPTGNGAARYRHFKMKNCVEIFGGFEGIENPNSFDLMDRNLNANATVLSGANNRFHVFYNTGIDATAVLDGCTITGGKADGENGTSNDPKTYQGGGMFNEGADPRIENCKITANRADGLGGGMYNIDSSPKIENCTFSGNYAPDQGGGMYIIGGKPKMVNCLFSGNTATQGGGVFNNMGNPIFINTTIASNLAQWTGGGLHNHEGLTEIKNGIIWGNKVKFESWPNEYWGHQIYNELNSTIDIDFSCYKIGGQFHIYDAGTINYGPGSLTSDPQFVAPESALSAPTTAGNYRLQSSSTAIDEGNSWYVPAGVDTDIDWNLRIENITVDMGAYESPQDCLPPRNLAAINITDNSADLTWIPGGSEALWNIEWGPAGFIKGTGNIINGVGVFPFPLGGLNLATSYDFYVQANCGGGNLSNWAGPCNFTTLANNPCNTPTNLTVSNTTDVSAQLDWTPGGTETSWNIEYGPASFVLGTGTLISGVGNPHLHTGLTPGTPYDFYVQADCGGGSSSAWAGPCSFTTLYSCDYSFTLYDTYGDGWNGATMDVIQFGVVVQTIGTGFISGNTFTEIVTIFDGVPFDVEWNVGGTWPAECGLEITDPFGTQLYFAHPIGALALGTILYSGTGNCPFNCLAPVSLYASNISNSSAELNWTPGGTETSWNIEYGPAGFVLGTGIFISGVGNPYLLTGLTSNFDYEFYVRANCGGGSLSNWAGPCPFTTLSCLPFALPFYEDFTSCTFPACWTETSNVSPGLWNVANSNLAGGQPCEMKMQWTNGIGTTRLISPPLNTTGANNVKLQFLTYIDDFAPGAYLIIQSSNDGINWTDEGWTHASGTGDIPSGTLVDIPILYNLGSTTYIAWVIEGDHFQFDYWHVDGVSIFENTPCLPPTNLTVAPVSGTSADLTWTPGSSETSWNIEYGLVGFVLGTGTLIQNVGNPYAITGLLPGTNYDFYVQANCSGGVTSPWSTPCNAFTFFCQTLNIPQGWSGISTWLDPQPNDVVSMFAPAAADLVIMMNMTDFWWPAMGINTLVNWDVNSGYAIKVQNDVSLQVCGTLPATNIFTLNPGWNLMPMLKSTSISTSVLFGGLSGMVLAKEIGGSKIYWPYYNLFSLVDLEPGKAYYLYASNGGTLSFAKSGATAKSPVAIEVGSPWNEVIQTGISHLLAVNNVSGTIEKGEIIGAFNSSGQCTGYSLFDGMSAVLTIFSDDVTTPEIDGMTEGEDLVLKVFNPETNTDRVLVATFDASLPDSDGIFRVGGISAVSLKTGLEIIDGSTMVSIYPNPAKDNIQISVPEGKLSNAEYVIFDFMGRTVLSGSLGGMIRKDIDISGLSSGVYQVALISNDNRIVKKLIVQ